MTIEKQSNTNLNPLLEVKDFTLRFRQYGKGLRETELEVIHQFNLTIYPGEIVAVVGASGSGKSLLADAILGILPENAITGGTLNYKGTSLSEKRQTALRGKEISLIPQSVTALDPLMKTGKQVETAVAGKDKKAVQEAIFQKVGLPERTDNLYPFELSGGMSRRVLVSTAMVGSSNLIIADEPTPGLDPEALQETMKHMKQLVTEDKGMMFITHDIEVAIQLADRIAVFYKGETVDMVHAADFSGKGERLNHPYTKALWNALPQNGFAPPVLSESDFTQVTQERQITKKTENAEEPLNVKGISYHYSNSPWLFKKLQLSIEPGEIVGIFGYSGSGKSTMAEIIGGYRAPIEGEVLIGGQPISSMVNPVQVVWQHPEKAINPRWRMEKILQETGNWDIGMMEIIGIKQEWLKRWPSELSGGELQRFSLARALASENIRYLIADEMTTMLDAVTQAKIWHAVLKLAKERDIGVLAISHDHHLLQKISDRIINFSEIL